MYKIKTYEGLLNAKKNYSLRYFQPEWVVSQIRNHQKSFVQSKFQISLILRPATDLVAFWVLTFRLRYSRTNDSARDSTTLFSKDILKCIYDKIMPKTSIKLIILIMVID